jgi:hypothetical protein
MIYEMVDNCLRSLANQWRELSRAFQQLVASLSGGDPRRQVLDNDVPLPNRGLQQLCDDEQVRIEAWRITNQNLRPALLLFQQATSVLQDSETVRIGVDNSFQGAFSQPADNTVEMAFCRNQLEQLREFIARCLQEFEEITSPEGQRFSLSGIRRSVENITSYPVLTSELGVATPSLPSAPISSGAVTFQRTIDDALQAVLGGWRPKASDPKGFVTALNQVFTPKKIGERTEWTWSQRSYIAHSELGGRIMGAQAILFQKAKAAQEAALPLLDGLKPLNPNVDLEDVEAVRAIVRKAFVELVSELGKERGPRVQRVDRFFSLLLRYSPGAMPILNPLRVDGQLGRLRNLLFDIPSRPVRDVVNTIEEQQNFTNYEILVREFTSLCVTWNELRGRIDDLGTQLAELTRVLSVVAESVREVIAAMDSVFFSSTERETIQIGQGTEAISVADLLSWIESFALEEARVLIEDGGRHSVEQITLTLQLFSSSDPRALGLVNQLTDNRDERIQHSRVQRTLRELTTALNNAIQRAGGI